MREFHLQDGDQNEGKRPAGLLLSSLVLSASKTSMMCSGGTYHSNRVACFFVLLIRHFGVFVCLPAATAVKVAAHSYSNVSRMIFLLLLLRLSVRILGAKPMPTMT